MMNKLYGETYECYCEHGCYSVVNNGGTETEPSYCPFCGAVLKEKEIMVNDNTNNLYAVIHTSNCELAPVGEIFDDYNKAYANFEWNYLTLLTKEKEKPDSTLDLDKCNINIDDDYAIVQWKDGSYIKFTLAQLFKPSYDFEEYYNNKLKEDK